MPNDDTALQEPTPDTEGSEQNPPMEGSGKTFTQEEVNKLVGNARMKERGKYSDYDELKANAARLDELEEKGKSALEKANEKLAKAMAENDSLKKAAAKAEWIRNASEKTGVPESLLHGDTEEEVEANAQALAEWGGAKGYPDTPNSGEPGKNEAAGDWLRAALTS